MRHIPYWIANLGLWPRFALTISFSFIALFTAFSMLEERALYDDSERLLDARLIIARMAASQVDGVLQEAISTLEQAHQFASFDPVNPDLSVETGFLARIYGQVGIFTSGIAFLDSSGRVILTHPANLHPADTNLATLPHIAQALTEQKVTISEGFRDPLNRQPVTAVTVPIVKNNRFIGLLSGLVDLEGAAIETALQQSAMLGHTEHAALIDNQGRALASTFDLPFLSPGEHFSFYRRAVATGQPVVETVPFELDLPDEPLDHLHVMALAPLRHAPWAVAVGGDLDDTFAGVTRLRQRLILLGILALVIIWAVTLIGARRLMQPIKHLTTAAQRITAGDLQTPLHVSSGNEIGVLSTALEAMRQQLLANIESLTQWNDTLEAHVAEQTKKLQQQQAITQRLLRRTITAQENERGHFARELHDGFGQMLTAIEIGLERLAKTLPPDDEDARKYVTQSQELIEHSLVDLRRIITALRPGVLDQLGLAPALEWLGNHTLRPLGITITVANDGIQRRLPGEIEIILFRIAQEATSNIARHSQAKQATISLHHTQEQVALTITDDGRGFDMPAAAPAPNHGNGLGLVSMRERALLAGGQVSIISAPAMGTVIQAIIPLPAAIDEAHLSIDKLLEVQKHRINGNQPHKVANEQVLVESGPGFPTKDKSYG